MNRRTLFQALIGSAAGATVAASSTAPAKASELVVHLRLDDTEFQGQMQAMRNEAVRLSEAMRDTRWRTTDEVRQIEYDSWASANPGLVEFIHPKFLTAKYRI